MTHALLAKRQPHEVVFLLDVDNTLLDNDCIAADLDNHLRRGSAAKAATGIGQFSKRFALSSVIENLCAWGPTVILSDADVFAEHERATHVLPTDGGDAQDILERSAGLRGVDERHAHNHSDRARMMTMIAAMTAGHYLSHDLTSRFFSNADGSDSAERTPDRFLEDCR